MIVDAIVGLFFGLGSFVIGLLPAVDPLDLGDFSGIWVGYAQWNTWLPLTELLACIVAYFGTMLLIYGYLVARSLWNWVPFV